MLKAHFFREPKTLSELIKNVEKAEKNGATPIEFSVIAIEEIDLNTFYNFSNNISANHKFLYKHYDQMNVNEYGLWNCVIVSCENEEDKIIVYNGGHTYPLYASILRMYE